MWKDKPLWWCMGDDLDTVLGTITTFLFLFTSCQCGKCCSSFTEIVSHFPSRYFFLSSLRISPLWLLFLVFFYLFIYFLVSWYNKPYWCRTNNWIHISINLVDCNWITDIFNSFFWPYIEKMKYFLITDTDYFKVSVV